MKIYQHKLSQIAYGPRMNTTVWTSGCSIRCKGCFNPLLFDGSLGKAVSPLYILAVVRKGRAQGDTGLAFVGGEPFDQALGLALTLGLIRLVFPKHILTVYSGYAYPSLMKRWQARLALAFADYLVDGPFLSIPAPPDNLSYRGSANQRVIDLKRTTQITHPLIANWDNLLVFSASVISGPPHLMNLLDIDLANDEECGLVEESLPAG